MKIERFEQIEAWKQARTLVNMVYKAIDKSLRFKKDSGFIKYLDNAKKQ